MTYQVEQSTIKLLFPILTSSPPPQTKLAALLFRTGNWSKGTKLTSGDGEERLA